MFSIGFRSVILAFHGITDLYSENHSFKTPQGALMHYPADTAKFWHDSRFKMEGKCPSISQYTFCLGDRKFIREKQSSKKHPKPLIFLLSFDDAKKLFLSEVVPILKNPSGSSTLHFFSTENTKLAHLWGFQACRSRSQDNLSWTCQNVRALALL